MKTWENATVAGTVVAAEFVSPGDTDGDGEAKMPGTFITIRLDGDPAICGGRVSVTYLPIPSTDQQQK